MIEPTEHRELAHAEAEGLAPGSIVASHGYVWLYTRLSRGVWTRYAPQGAAHVVTELPKDEGSFRLLRSAPVPLPAIGAILTAAQLASLPQKYARELSVHRERIRVGIYADVNDCTPVLLGATDITAEIEPPNREVANLLRLVAQGFEDEGS